MRILCASFWIVCVSACAWAQIAVVGDVVRLHATSELGVPLHSRAGNNGLSGRLPDGVRARVVAIDATTGWFSIVAQAGSGWITSRYIAEIVDDTPAPYGPPTLVDPLEPSGTIVIGAWNLEHFDPDKSRGFPENTRGGPTYPPRTAEDLRRLGATIVALSARVLVLSEIGEAKALDDLVAAMGAPYAYALGTSGDSQHIALLYDTRTVRLNGVCECDFPDTKVDGKGLFDRQPLVGHFTAMEHGAARNDFAVVGVHLASGQELTKNHDHAMESLLGELNQLRGTRPCLPQGEWDVAIMGDFNANRFDRSRELFWDAMESEGWDVLANDADSYPPTRLSGNPLALRGSTIDYIIVTRGHGGLQGEEIVSPQARVHTELIGEHPEAFRAYASDHLPVTVTIRVGTDTDE